MQKKSDYDTLSRESRRGPPSQCELLLCPSCGEKGRKKEPEEAMLRRPNFIRLGSLRTALKEDFIHNYTEVIKRFLLKHQQYIREVIDRQVWNMRLVVFFPDYGPTRVLTFFAGWGLLVTTPASWFTSLSQIVLGLFSVSAASKENYSRILTKRNKNTQKQ